MHPFITVTRQIYLDSWWVLMTVALAAGGLTALVLLRREVGWQRALLVVLAMVWGAMFGAHLGHYVFHPWLFRKDPLGLFVFWGDGQTFLGALYFCVLLLALLSACLRRLSFWAALDAFALAVPVGLFFARVGCYLKGCCWGTPISESHPLHGVSWKLVRNQWTALHPVQLYEAAAALAILAALLLVRKRVKTPGVLACTFAMLYFAARFVLEFFRADTGGKSVLGFLSVHQELGLIALPAAAGLCFFLQRRSRPGGRHHVEPSSGRGGVSAGRRGPVDCP